MPEEYKSVDEAAKEKVEADAKLKSAVEESKPAEEVSAFAVTKINADAVLKRAIERPSFSDYDWKSASEKSFEDQIKDLKTIEDGKDLETKEQEEKARKDEWEKYKIASEETSVENSFHRFFISHCQNNQLDNSTPTEIKKLHKAAAYLAKNDTKFIALIEALQLYLDTYYTKSN